ncbi:unnamed protein product [Rotaria sp. Silwood1]|nr:unnamed protein product [Rotaria sp. Silwood1]
MATHYIDNASSGSQYYFNTNNATTSQSSRNYSSPVGNYSSYPVGISSSSNQQIRYDDSYHTPQQYQSVGGFNKNLTQHHYQTSQSLTPQVRATARAVNNQDLYQLQRSPQPTSVSPQHHHFQFDNRQQPGHPTGPAVVYQTPGAAQYTHHNVDLWTEGPTQVHDHLAQAQRVSVRSVSTGSPQQSHSISPQRHQDHLQQYYSQLTPEQHQQLLRQQQIQRQQEQHSHHEQQHRVTAQQVSPSPTYQQEQHHRSTSGFDGGQHYQQIHVQSESERQRQDEQAYNVAHRQMSAQRVQQQQGEQLSHPVGIRSLMSKFTGPAPIQQYHTRSKSTSGSGSTSSRHYSTSTHTTNLGPRQTTTTRTLTTHSMTYSALPKPHEPPVNSLEYYQMQMQQQGGSPFTNIQQAAAPAHIQHTPTGFGALRDRFKRGSIPDEFNQPQIIHRQQQQQQQQSTSMTNGGNNLSSLRDHYMSQAKQATYNGLPTQQVQHISRTIIGEDTPQQKQQQQQKLIQQGPLQQQQAYTPQVFVQQQPAPVAQVFPQPQHQPAPQIPQQQQPPPTPQAPQQQQSPSATETPKQQSPPTTETPKKEQSETNNEIVDQKVPSSEVKSPATLDAAKA